MVLSTALTYHSSSHSFDPLPHAVNGSYNAAVAAPLRSSPTNTIRSVAAYTRRIAKALAFINATWIVFVSFAEISSFFSRCWCNSCDIMADLEHPNICQLKEAFYERSGDLALVLEYIDGGDLLEFILKKNGLCMSFKLLFPFLFLLIIYHFLIVYPSSVGDGMLTALLFFPFYS